MYICVCVYIHTHIYAALLATLYNSIPLSASLSNFTFVIEITKNISGIPELLNFI